MQANFFQPLPLKNEEIDVAYRKDRILKRIPGAISTFKAGKIQIKNCVFNNLGGAGIKLDHGGHANVIEDNFFSDIASSAIEVGTDMNTPSLDDSDVVPRNIVVKNNYIASIGSDYFGSVGILATYVKDITIANNEIYHVPWVGIHLGWGWRDNSCISLDDNCLVGNNKVNSNKITFPCEKLTDCAGIYTNNSNPNSEISNNYVSDAQWGHGIFLDEKSAGFDISNNILERNHNYHSNAKAGWIKKNLVDEGVNTFSNNSSYNACENPNRKMIIREAGLQMESEDMLTPYISDVANLEETSNIVIDHSYQGYLESSNDWQESYLNGYGDSKSRYTNINGASVSWNPALAPGFYKVYIYKIVHPESETNSKIIVNSDKGVDTQYLDFTSGSSGWVELGEYLFTADCPSEYYVKLERNTSISDHYTRADAVKFVWVDKSEPVNPQGNVYIIDNEDAGYNEINGTWGE